MSNTKQHNDLLHAVKDYLEINGWYTYQNIENRKRHYSVGIADLTAIKEGVVTWIEIKTGIGDLRPSQESFRDNILDKGGVYWVVRSLEDVQEFLINRRDK